MEAVGRPSIFLLLSFKSKFGQLNCCADYRLLRLLPEVINRVVHVCSWATAWTMCALGFSKGDSDSWETCCSCRLCGDKEQRFSQHALLSCPSLTIPVPLKSPVTGIRWGAGRDRKTPGGTVSIQKQKPMLQGGSSSADRGAAS